MDIFRHRPFALTLAIFLALSCAQIALSARADPAVSAAFLSVLVLGILLLFTASAAALLLMKITRRRLAVIVLSLALLLLGCTRIGIAATERAEASAIAGRTVTVSLSVRERETATAGYTRYRVLVESVNSCGEALDLTPFYATLVIPSAAEYRVLDKLTLEAEARPLSELSGAAYAASDGSAVALFLLEDAGSPTVEKTSEHSPLQILTVGARMRNRLSFLLREELGETVGAFSAAVLLGDRSALDESLVRDFSRAGISHLLAVSGLHMTVLVGGLALLLRLLGASRRATSVVTILATAFYLAFTGFSMSACRAGVMLLIFSVLGFLSRRPDPLTSLFLAVSTVILIFPSAAISVGLWLSFSSVLGLLTVSRLLDRSRKEKLAYLGFSEDAPTARRILGKALSWLLSGVSVSLVASFSILPVLLLSGMDFSLTAIPANLLTVSLLPLILVLILLFLALSAVPGFSTVSAAALRLLVGWITAVAHLFSSLPHAAVSLSEKYAIPAVALFTSLSILLLALPINRRKPRLGRATRSRLDPKWLTLPVLLATVLYTVGFFGHAAVRRERSPLPISVVSVADGEHLVYADRGIGILIDLSDGESRGYRTALNVGKSLGVTEWAAVVVTHYHTKGSSTVARFSRENLVRTVYLPEPETETDLERKALYEDRLAATETDTVTYEREASLRVGEISVELSHAVYLERSVQPIFRMTVSSDRESLVYYTAAAHETGLGALPTDPASPIRSVVIGSDGATPKRHFTPELGQGTLLLTYGDGIEELLTVKEPEEIKRIHGTSVVHLSRDLTENSEITDKGNENEPIRFETESQPPKSAPRTHGDLFVDRRLGTVLPPFPSYSVLRRPF